MEKYLAAVLTTFSIQAAAEPLLVPIPMACVSAETFAGVIGDQFEEVPLVRGMSKRFDPETKSNDEYPVVVFFNKETRTFTIAEKHDRLYCVISAGDGFEPLNEDGNPIENNEQKQYKGT